MPRQSLRELGARPPLERMLHIHAALARGGHPNCAGLARELEVASKTIQRDLDFMRDRLGLPLEYVPSRFGYAYTRRVDSFPLMQVSEGDLLALFVAQKALGSHPDTPFKASLTATFRKLAAALPSQLSVSWADLDSEFSYRAPGAARADVEVFERVTRALAERREIEFEYHKLDAATHERRRVRPYHVACVAGQWYLFAHDTARGAVRTFVLARMRAPRLEEARFERPRGFSVERLLRGSFGVVEGGKARRVVLRFDAWAARLVTERAWHPSQRVRPVRGGGAEVEFRLGSLFEVERWILGWAGHVEVRFPAELRRRVGQAGLALGRANGAPAGSRR